MVAFQERINRQGRRYIDDLRVVVSQLWSKSCGYEEIGSDARFVVFSIDNPFVPFYNRAWAMLGEARTQYAAGGYVGLSVRAGKGRG